jgi:hypothetical protein
MVQTVQMQSDRHSESRKSYVPDAESTCPDWTDVTKDQRAEDGGHRQRHRIRELEKIAVPQRKLENLISVATYWRQRSRSSGRILLRWIDRHVKWLGFSSPTESDKTQAGSFEILFGQAVATVHDQIPPHDATKFRSVD